MLVAAIQTKQIALLVTLTVVAVGLLDMIVRYTTAMNQTAQEHLAVRGKLATVQVLATKQPVKAIVDVAGQTRRKTVLDLATKVLVKVIQAVLGTIQTALISTATNQAAKAQVAVRGMVMIALALATTTHIVVEHTMPIAALVHTLQVIAQAHTAQLVRELQVAEVLTTPQTATTNLDVLGRLALR